MRFPSFEECLSVNGLTRTLIEDFEERMRNEYLSLLARADGSGSSRSELAAVAATLTMSMAARIAVDASSFIDSEADKYSFLELAAEALDWAQKRAGQTVIEQKTAPRRRARQNPTRNR